MNQFEKNNEAHRLNDLKEECNALRKLLEFVPPETLREIDWEALTLYFTRMSPASPHSLAVIDKIRREGARPV